MTTYLSNYLNPIYQTSLDDYYNGVVYVGNGFHGGTGSLLYDGKSILTAAHIFYEEDLENIRVYFPTASGYDIYNASITFYDNYDPINLNGDLAILTLDENPLSNYQRYDIYRNSDELGQDFTMLGYGNLGIGYLGAYDDNIDNIKLKTENTFEADFYDIYTNFRTNLSWIPEENSILTADFDSGSYSNDALRAILGIYDLGTGITEGMIASGDSGGPAFIDDKIAGIASYGASINVGLNDVDVDKVLNSSFGELGAWQRVSYYSEWIDKIIRANYEDTPKSKDEVKKIVEETDIYAYFLLEYTANRDLIDDVITLNYKTKDGTAKAGSDYIEISGTIAIYKDELQVVIPVEILDDNISENNEYFYLEVSNPNYGSFGENIETLAAIRYISDDDFI